MLALLLALASPELELRGISVSYGNTVVENAYRNAVEILRRAGRRITPGVGARRPLKRQLAEALDTVLRAELPTELVGLDVTREAVLGPQEVTRLAHSQAPNARWIHDALRFYIEFHKQAEGLDGCIVNDVLPIAVLLRPDTLTFEDRNLAVGLDDGGHRGHTRGKPDGARVRVATQVDMSKVWPLLSERVFRWATRATPTAISQEGATA